MRRARQYRLDYNQSAKVLQLQIVERDLFQAIILIFRVRTGCRIITWTSVNWSLILVFGQQGTRATVSLLKAMRLERSPATVTNVPSPSESSLRRRSLPFCATIFVGSWCVEECLKNRRRSGANHSGRPAQVSPARADPPQASSSRATERSEEDPGPIGRIPWSTARSSSSRPPATRPRRLNGSRIPSLRSAIGGNPSTNQEIEITPEMMEAVERELAIWSADFEPLPEKALSVIKVVLANL